MSEQISERKADAPKGRGVAILGIIAATIVSLACIAACTGVAMAFLLNPPWR